MGLFDFLKDKKQETREITGDVLLAQLNGGCFITAKQAQEIPAVAACLEYVGNKVALLPLKLYERDEEGRIREIKHDRRTRLFNIQPSEYFDGFLRIPASTAHSDRVSEERFLLKIPFAALLTP